MWDAMLLTDMGSLHLKIFSSITQTGIDWTRKNEENCRQNWPDLVDLALEIKWELTLRLYNSFGRVSITQSDDHKVNALSPSFVPFFLIKLFQGACLH